jgi:uncharacterized protein YjbJ (UPF0337 family)
MNWDQVKGNWRQWQGSFQKKWGQLTNNDLAVIEGDRERMLGILQERYGSKREELERDLDAYVKMLT